MRPRKEKPAIKVEIKRAHHPDAEVVTIILSGAEAADREFIMDSILDVVGRVIETDLKARSKG